MQDLGVGARFGVEVWPGLVGLQLRVSGDEMDGIQASGSGPDADDALILSVLSTPETTQNPDEVETLAIGSVDKLAKSIQGEPDGEWDLGFT